MGDPACGAGFEIRGRRIAVDEYLRAKGHEDVFVAGDMACTTDPSGVPQPPTAHIAMVQGDLVAKNVLATINGGDLGRYKYERVGEIVTLGRGYAVGELFGLKFTGLLARIMKKAVHLWYVFSIGGIRLLLGT
jgi:NADH dehydrogenase